MPDMAEFVLAIAVVPVTARGAPGVAPATTTAGVLKLEKPVVLLLFIEVLLANRISPPNLNVCLPFVQLRVSPYVQSGLLSVEVTVMLLPVRPEWKQLAGGRAPLIGLHRPMPPVMSGSTRKPFTGAGRYLL